MKLITKLVLFVVLMTVMSGNVFAAPGINRKINFQGKVVNKGVGSTDGTNVNDSNYNFTFSLWTTLSAGSSIWSEVWNGGTAQVPVTSGIFQVSLGTYSTFPPSVNFNSDSLYVSVNFNGDGDMSPRIQLSAVPYAFNAEKVGGLTVTNTDATLSIGNSKTITFGDNFTTISGVGITLNQSLSTADSPDFVDLSLTGTLFVGAGVTGSNGQVLSSNGAGGLAWITPGGATYYANNGLTMTGTTVGLGGTLGQNTQIGLSGYDLSFVGVGGSSILGVTADGKVGIGTTAPGYKLHVVGDAYVSTTFGVGGSLSLTGLAVGVGTSVLYIGADGNVIAGTMPVTSVANSKVIVLSPEYSGSALSADGSGTTAVSMTSDNSLNAGGVGWKNYYELSSTNAALQDYSVIVRVTLPSDFNTWETGSCPGSTCALEFAYSTGVGATADNSISYIISNDVDTPATAVCSIGNTASTSWGASGCTEAVLNDNAAPEWDSAGETAVIRIKLAAKNTASALTRAGDIILRYRSRF